MIGRDLYLYGSRWRIAVNYCQDGDELPCSWMEGNWFISGARVILSRTLLVPQYCVFVYTYERSVFIEINWSRDSSVDVVTRLWAERPTSRYFVPECLLPFSTDIRQALQSPRTLSPFQRAPLTLPVVKAASVHASSYRALLILGFTFARRRPG